MITRNMREYDYFTIDKQKNSYGQPQISNEPIGKVKMSITVITKAVENNALYENANYLGLTTSAEVDDTFVINFGEERLKVLYVIPQGRLKQVFMKKI